jgi:Rieske 2Fe-2S family protein
MAPPIGIWGYPYIDLEPFLDLGALPAIHEEICAALPRVEVGQTGGSLKWMGVVADRVARDPYADSMQVIAGFTQAQFRELVSLADDPTVFDPERFGEYEFGDETDHPLNARQMRLLTYKYGVYFPWKVVYHFVENVRWEDKNSGAGKGTLPEAEERFPLTVAFLRALPFQEIGRCLLFGLEANDHAPLHRDTEPDRAAPVQHCMTIVPAGNKRLYLMDPDEEEKLPVAARAYWFNDMDWHGVEPDPFFRYSIRVDGVFRPDFVARLREVLCR